MYIWHEQKPMYFMYVHGVFFNLFICKHLDSPIYVGFGLAHELHYSTWKVHFDPTWVYGIINVHVTWAKAKSKCDMSKSPCISYMYVVFSIILFVIFQIHLFMLALALAHELSLFYLKSPFWSNLSVWYNIFTCDMSMTCDICRRLPWHPILIVHAWEIGRFFS